MNLRQILSRHILLYGTSLAILLFFMKWLHLRYVVINYSFEIYVLFIALLFTGLGGWLALKLSRPKPQTIIVEKEVFIERPTTTNDQEIARLNLSRRELEVLGLIASGLTNQEIADQLFLSLNTIKTHSSRIFEKLEVERRTQAVEKAKRLNLIP